jgi:hypothetical protein
MWEILSTYWPHILGFVSLAMTVVAASHAAMTKDEVRAAIGWVGVIVLSPIIGPLIYAVAGINRIRRASIVSQRKPKLGAYPRRADLRRFPMLSSPAHVGRRFAALKTLGDKATRRHLKTGNAIAVLWTGDEAYGAMIAAIAAAERSIILETYIFDRDPLGLRIADALIEARRTRRCGAGADRCRRCALFGAEHRGLSAERWRAGRRLQRQHHHRPPAALCEPAHAPQAADRRRPHRLRRRHEHPPGLHDGIRRRDRRARHAFPRRRAGRRGSVRRRG